MNRKYITRQITSHKLGIPMSKDIKKYYDCFYQLIGDINELDKLLLDRYKDTIFWRKDDIVILQYDEIGEYFVVDHDKIWSKYYKEYGLKTDSIRELLSSFLQDFFGLKVTTTYHAFLKTKPGLIELFREKMVT